MGLCGLVSTSCNSKDNMASYRFVNHKTEMSYGLGGYKGAIRHKMETGRANRMLDLDSFLRRQGVWTNKNSWYSTTDICASFILHSLQRKGREGKACMSQMRQSKMRQSRTLICGNIQRQSSGYEKKGETPLRFKEQSSSINRKRCFSYSYAFEAWNGSNKNCSTLQSSSGFNKQNQSWNKMETSKIRLNNMKGLFYGITRTIRPSILPS